jgi:hypothetical protein
VTSGWHAALAAACLAGAAPAGLACELVLSEHRSGIELMRLPLDPRSPEVQIAFEHSVLGTTVVDRYRFTPQARLVEERFDGQGYGLPHAAGAGETLQRDGSGWRLRTDRLVHPLVVRPLPQQRMRLLVEARTWFLADLSTQAIELTSRDCPAAIDE